MTVQLTQAQAQAVLSMFKGEHANDTLELDHGIDGELMAEWLNQPETHGPVFAHGVTGTDTRTCTCHPDDNPPKPCPRKFALTECLAAAGVSGTREQTFRTTDPDDRES